MKKPITLRVSAFSVAALLALTACGTAVQQSVSVLPESADVLTPLAVSYSERDRSGAYDDSVQTIALSGTGVTITEPGTYVLSGALADGQIVVNAGDKDKVQLVLDGVSIRCSDGPAVWVQSADKVFLTLAEGSQNTLSDGSAYTNTELNACIYAAADLTVNGSGSLTVNGNYNHGIYTKDDLTITGGALTVTAVNDGLKGKDAVQIADGTLTVTAGGDGIQSSSTDSGKGYVSIDGGTLTITADGDGIQAESRLQVTDGTLTLTTGGGSANAPAHTGGALPGGGRGGFGGGMPPEGMESGERPQRPASGDFTPPEFDRTAVDSAAQTDEATVSAKGLKGVGSLLVTGGTITADCADDALHTNGSTGITGGTLTLRSGDDGIHADDALLLSGGTIDILQSYEGLEGLEVTISGGAVTVQASDDGINAAGGADASGMGGRQDPFAAAEGACIRITGGTIHVTADGDGVDSNGDLIVSGGTLYVDGPANSGNGALDYNGTATIEGGTVIAVCAAGMAEGFGEASTQCSFLVSLPASVGGGTMLTVTDSAGKTLASFTPSRDYQAVCVSLPALQKGASYTVTAGGQTKTVTLDTAAVNEGGGRPGGRPGGDRTKPAVSPA